MEALEVLDLLKTSNPKPPYECKAIRRNPDLIKIENKEPPLFREDYEEHVMSSGQKVYQREFTVDGSWYDDETYDEIEIISREEWEQLPIQSTGELEVFRKEINKKVWGARGNGINHYHPWYESAYHIDSMFDKIELPQLEFHPVN